MKPLAMVPGRRFCLVAVCWLAAWHAQAAATDLPDAPGWTLKNVEGKTVRLSDFRGKVVILDFWASWCAPCRQEIPGFVELQKKYAGRGLTVIGISLDDDPQLMKAAAQKLHMTYPVVFGTPGVAAAYGQVTVVPSTFVINREGKITALHEGFCEKAIFEAEIKPLL